jgi:hypothetical protein
VRCCQAAVRRGPQDSPLQVCRQLDALHTHTPLLPSPACGACGASCILVSFTVLAGSRPAAFRAPHRMDRPAPAPAIPLRAPARTPRQWNPQRILAQLECCDVLQGCVGPDLPAGFVKPAPPSAHNFHAKHATSKTGSR